MKVQTTRFGEIQVPDTDIIIFPRGILGFEGLTKYVLIDLDSKGPFSYLQSLEDQDLTFVVMDPSLIWADYHVEVSPNEVKELAVENVEDVTVLSIVTVPANPKLMTANLQGPLLINGANRKGKQIVLTGDTYKTRHRVFPDVSRSQTA